MSGHIDLCQRFQNENLLSYLSGTKRLVPKMRDLTFYNWAIGEDDSLREIAIWHYFQNSLFKKSTLNSGKADFRSSANFEVVFEPPSKLFLRHRASSAMVDVSKSGFGDDGETERSVRQLPCIPRRLVSTTAIKGTATLTSLRVTGRTPSTVTTCPGGLGSSPSRRLRNRKEEEKKTLSISTTSERQIKSMTVTQLATTDRCSAKIGHLEQAGIH